MFFAILSKKVDGALNAGNLVGLLTTVVDMQNLLRLRIVIQIWIFRPRLVLEIWNIYLF